MKLKRSEAEREAWGDAVNRMEWACAGKHGFDAKSTADKVVQKMSRSKTKKPTGQITTYRCKFCQKWHIGGRYV